MTWESRYPQREAKAARSRCRSPERRGSGGSHVMWPGLAVRRPRARTRCPVEPRRGAGQRPIRRTTSRGPCLCCRGPGQEALARPARRRPQQGWCATPGLEIASGHLSRSCTGPYDALGAPRRTPSGREPSCVAGSAPGQCWRRSLPPSPARRWPRPRPRRRPPFATGAASEKTRKQQRGTRTCRLRRRRGVLSEPRIPPSPERSSSECVCGPAPESFTPSGCVGADVIARWQSRMSHPSSARNSRLPCEL